MPDAASATSRPPVIARILEPGARYYLLASTFFVVVPPEVLDVTGPGTAKTSRP